jgi:hypothetical protein
LGSTLPVATQKARVINTVTPMLGVIQSVLSIEVFTLIIVGILEELY